MTNQTIQDRLFKLRQKMSDRGIDYFLIPTADFHNSEYVAPYFQARTYFSGFTGSSGTLVVGLHEAGLWTDGRYYIQAAKELEGTGVDLYRDGEEGVPAVSAWLADRFSGIATGNRETESPKRSPALAFDGRCVSVSQVRRFREKLSERNVRFVTEIDPAEGIWEDRPARPAFPALVLGEEYAGESSAHKVGRLRRKMQEEGASIYVENKLDNLMWLFNLRGRDVECTPVALSFGLVTMERQILFLQDGAVTEEVRNYADRIGLEIRPYEEVFDFLEKGDLYSELVKRQEIPGTEGWEEGRRTGREACRIWFSPASLSCRLYEALQKGRDEALRGGDPATASAEDKPGAQAASARSRAGLGTPCADIEKRSPAEDFKAVKNETELKNIRACYRDDSAAVCRFLFWLARQTEEGRIGSLTELDAQRKMDSLRREIGDFVELSFGTISAYGPNAAMMHYSAREETCARLKPEGMLLVDCGGQYLRGTTDVTRTMALGPVTDEMRRDYTLTAVGNLQLMDAVFLYGCTGKNVDILARQPLWRQFTDYKCGTGHGIGYLLSVHEGPQNIRWRFAPGSDEVVLEPGMIVSDEPGVYIEGKYGIRIETILEVVDVMKNSDGRFLRFSPLTLVPLDPALIDPAYLTPQTRQALNAYHARVYEEISPLLDREERAWLRAATRPI